MKNYNDEILFLCLLNIPRVGRKTAYKFYKSLNDKIRNEDDLFNAINIYKNNSNKFPRSSGKF